VGIFYHWEKYTEGPLSSSYKIVPQPQNIGGPSTNKTVRLSSAWAPRVRLPHHLPPPSLSLFSLCHISLSLFSPLSASSAQCSFHFFSTRLSCILILVSERVSEVQSYACAAAVSFAATSSLSAAAGDGGHEGRRRCIPRRRRQAGTGHLVHYG
jgi:hypothetical protein